jgi:hypothetical protein
MSLRTLKNNFTRKIRSGERTMARCLGIGPKKIMNNNIGTPSEQCGKFARYSQLDAEYKRDPNPYIQNLLSFLKADQVYFAMLNDTIPDSRNPSYLGKSFLDRFTENQYYAQRMLTEIPDDDKYLNLKQELRYFIPFMYGVYRTQLKALMDAYSIHTTPKNNLNRFFTSGRKRGRKQTRKRR